MDFIVYCDESSHTNSEARRYMVLGSLWLPRTGKPIVQARLNNLMRERFGESEAKWSKVSDSFVQPYVEVVRVFLEEQQVRFRAIIVDRQRVDIDVYHKGDQELGFYKFYYQLLIHWLSPEHSYDILLDHKVNSIDNRLTTLRNVLNNKLGTTGTVRLLEPINSRQSRLSQLCDVLTGAVAASANDAIRRDSGKRQITDILASAMGWNSLNTATARSFQKFNLFRIDLDVEL